MSEEPIKKLNLKALQVTPKTSSDSIEAAKVISNSPEDNVLDTKKSWETVEAKEASTFVAPLKISFNSIKKSDPTDSPKKESEPVVESIEKDQAKTTDTITTVENMSSPKIWEAPQNKLTASEAVDTAIKSDTLVTWENQTSTPKKEINKEDNTNKINIKGEEEKKKKRKFSFFRKKKEKKEDIPLVQIEEKVEEKQDEAISFSNYESHFKTESSNFLKRFWKFKYAAKTRIWFLIGLIWLSTLSIWVLMIAMPEKHSPEIYKASILHILWKQELIVEDTFQSTIPASTTIIQEEVKQEEQKEEVIQWAVISKEWQQKEKLKQHLIEKYK